MTVLSPRIVCVAMKSENKGSTYGKPQCWSSYHSFQESSGNGGSYNSNGAQVLYSQAPLCSLQPGCIIRVDATARGRRQR